MTSAPSSISHRPRMMPIWLAGTFVLVLIAISIAFAVQREHGTTNGSREGSGVAGTQVRHLEPFSAVDLAGANTVTIRVGPAQQVTVRGDDNLLDRVTTAVSAGTLAIGNRGSFRTTAPMNVDIAVPELTGVTLSGSGTIAVSGMEADTFTVRLPGAGTIDASGQVHRISATLGGAGTIQLTGLIARDAVAVIDGSGTIVLYASRSLDARIAGTGTIEYTGSPRNVSRHLTGTGSISG
jgi:hypothetical protein